MNIGRLSHGLETTQRATETFRMIPDRMWLHHEVKDFDLRLWCSLLFLARGRNHCNPTDSVLAEKLGCSVQTVQRGLLRLERASFIEREMEGRDRTLTLKPEGDAQPMPEFGLRVV
jgi:predicted transcriptional regulator